jgi:hypothetical protein
MIRFSPFRARRTRAALALFLLSLAACPQETAIWVAPGSTARDLTLVLGRKPGRERRISSYVRIDRCGEFARIGYAYEAMWIVGVDASRITYGHTGPAAVEQMKARPLVPGCYHATTSGTGEVAFTVDSAGAVTQLESVPTFYP